MKKKFLNKTAIKIFVFFIVLTAIFFYKVFLKGYVPFPGDLLLAEYQPWRSYSFAGYNPGAIPNKAQYFDPLRQMYPWKTAALTMLKRGELPLWNPYNFSGSPLFANFQSSLMFPLDVFYFVLPHQWAWTLLVILQPFLCLITTYLLCRLYGLTTIAAAFSAVTYSFCLYMTTFLEYNIFGHYLWLLPFGLLGIETFLMGKKRGLISILGTVITAGFSGQLQLYFLTCLYLGVYSIIRVWSESKKYSSLHIKQMYLFLFLGIGITAIQILPTVELIHYSARVAHTPTFILSDLLVHLDKLILYLVPDLFGNPATKNYLLPFSYPSKAMYVGIGTVLFALLSFWVTKKSAQYKTILGLTSIIFLCVFLTPVSWVLTQLQLPFINSSSPSNALYLVSFGICLMAGFGVDAIKNTLPKKTILLPITLFLFLGLFVLSLLVTNTAYRINNLIYSTIILTTVSLLFGVSIFVTKIKNYTLILLLTVTCIDLFYFFQKFNPFVPASFLYPQTEVTSWLQKNAGIQRFWGYGSANIEANFATHLGLYAPDGYDPLYPKDYGKLITSSKAGNLTENFDRYSRSDATVPTGFGETNMMDNPYRLKLLSALGVSYILDKTENGSTAKTFPIDHFEKVASLGDYHILKYKKAAARYFFTTHYDTYINDAEFFSKFYSPTFDPQTTVLLATKPSFVSSTNTQQSVALLSYASQKISFKVETNQHGLVYLSDTYFPGWQAYINGQKTQILKANYTFRAIEVPPGAHTVDFVYKPFSFTVGSIVSMVSLGIAFLVYRYILPLKTKKYE